MINNSTLPLIVFTFDVEEQGYLNEEDEWDAILKLLVHCLVMPYFHSYPGADTPTYDGKKQQSRF